MSYQAVCTVCSHPALAEVDASLAAGVSHTALGQEYPELSRYAIGRHVRSGHPAHVLDPATPGAGPAGIPSDLARLRDRAEDFMAQAEAEGKSTAVVSAMRELRLLDEALAKRQPSTVQVVDWSQDAGWLATRTAIVAALPEFGACGCRERVVSALDSTNEQAR